MSEDTDYIELKGRTGELHRFVECDDGSWLLDGDATGWGFTTDDAGKIRAMDPPGGPYMPLRAVTLTTHQGRKMIVAAIDLKEKKLFLELEPK